MGNVKEAIIKVTGLEKTYGGRVPVPALKGVSFEVKQGEFLAIMGRSGSGKSTLLRQLGLLDVPTAGKVIVGGTDVSKLSDKEKTSFRLHDFGYIFQEYALLPELTVYESVALPLMMQGEKESNYKEKAVEIIGRVGLGERLGHLPGELSGGEQQRVAIARAMVNDPKIVFADEPCANLDSETAKVILDLLKELNRKLDQTIIMVTHEEEDMKYVERAIWLKDGLIEKIENLS